MTPVQLPEVPARRDCVAFRWEGEPINEASDPPWKYASHWSTPPWDHRPIECLYTAAQLREYATAAVLADRASIDAADILAGVQRWELGSNQFGFGIHHRQGGSFVKRADVVVAIAAYATPSETNSER